MGWMSNESVAASSPHKGSFLHMQPGILDRESCIPLKQGYWGQESSLWLNTCKVFQGVPSLQPLPDSAGESGPVLEKADGPDGPSLEGSFGVLFPMDATAHQPQGHLWSPVCFCFQFSLHRKTLQHPMGCWPWCFGSTPSHLFRLYHETRWLHLKCIYINQFGWTEIAITRRLLGNHDDFQYPHPWYSCLEISWS